MKNNFQVDLQGSSSTALYILQHIPENKAAMRAKKILMTTGKNSQNAWSTRVQEDSVPRNCRIQLVQLVNNEPRAHDERHEAGERVSIGREQVDEREAARVRTRSIRRRARRWSGGGGLSERRQAGEERVLALLACPTRLHCAPEAAFDQHNRQRRQDPVAEHERRCCRHCIESKKELECN